MASVGLKKAQGTSTLTLSIQGEFERSQPPAKRAPVVPWHRPGKLPRHCKVPAEQLILSLGIFPTWLQNELAVCGSARYVGEVYTYGSVLSCHYRHPVTWHKSFKKDRHRWWRGLLGKMVHFRLVRRSSHPSTEKLVDERKFPKRFQCVYRHLHRGFS